MEESKIKKFWIYVGITIAAVLLLWWLFVATLVNEDADEMAQNGVESIE